MPDAPEVTEPLLCSPDDLAVRLGVPATDPALLVAARMASDKFRDAVSWQVHELTRTLYANGTGNRDLLLRARAVSDVAAVRVSGVLVETDWDEDGVITRADCGRWPRGRRNVQVDLTYGYDPIPGGIAAAVLERAEEAYSVIRGLSSKQVGGITVTYSSSAGATQEWVDAVEAHRVGGRA